MQQSNKIQDQTELLNSGKQAYNTKNLDPKVLEKLRGIQESKIEQKATMDEGRKVLPILFLTLVLDLLAFTCILPLFPSIFDYYAAKPDRDVLYWRFDDFLTSFRKAIGAPDLARFNSVFFGGLLGTIFSFLQFLTSPMLGALSDVYGRKKILLISVAGTLVSYVLWSKSVTFSIFVLSRIVGGASKASVSVATAIVADVCGPAHRGKGMALVGVSFSVGFIIGPSIGAYFASQARTAGSLGDSYYFSTPAYFAICLTVLELLCILFLMPETLKKENRRESISEVVKKAGDFVNPKSLFSFRPLEGSVPDYSLKTLKDTGFVYFLYLFIYSGLEFTLTFFTHIRFNYDSMQQGRMYLFAGLLMALVQGGYVRRIPSANQRKAAQWGLGFIIPAFVMVGLATNAFLLYTGLSLYSLASGIVVPCLTAMVASYGSEKEKGTIMGIFRSLGALARAVGPLIASAVFWCLGPVPCYVTGGLLLSIPYMLLRKMSRNERAE